MSSEKRRSLYLFSNDLRLDDNPALNHALGADEASTLYYRDTSSPWLFEGAAAWWLEQNLFSLADSLSQHKLQLNFLSGEGINNLTQLIKKHDFTEVCIARAYTKYDREQQAKLSQWCKENDVHFKRFPGVLLFEPEQIKNNQGSFYKVFTPFYKNTQQGSPRSPQVFCDNYASREYRFDSEKLSDWKLYSAKPDWAAPLSDRWTPGENAAQACLKNCAEDIIDHYEEERNSLGSNRTSHLSPYLNLGILSPARIWQDISAGANMETAQAWLRQLVWREFNYHLLFHQPDMESSEFQEKFSHFDWQKDSDTLRLWQKGLTGYPAVDAAMNELWQTGWMHNRARMIVASFLTKHLQQHWLCGARWFWHTLIDADLANNTGGWQWTAGCGADAAPYFRIFNPITQGEKFDKSGHYVRKWLPALKNLPHKYLFAPWQAPEEVLQEAGITLGENYPLPIVEHKFARERALEAYSALSR